MYLLFNKIFSFILLHGEQGLFILAKAIFGLGLCIIVPAFLDYYIIKEKKMHPKLYVMLILNSLTFIIYININTYLINFNIFQFKLSNILFSLILFSSIVIVLKSLIYSKTVTGSLNYYKKFILRMIISNIVIIGLYYFALFIIPLFE